MKTTIAITAAALVAFSAPAFAGAHAQVNLNAADAAGNAGSVLGAAVSGRTGSFVDAGGKTVDVPEANAAGKVLKSAGGWGNAGSAAFSPLGQVSKGGPGGRSDK